MNSFERLEVEIKGLKSRVDSPGAVAFLVEECMRFYSIAGSLTATFALKNDSAEERYLTHILGRSLLEGFFWVLYIFDKEGETNSRYEEKLGAFRREYGKLHTEDIVPGIDKLPLPEEGWAALPKSIDPRSMLAQVKNIHGDDLSYLYYTYRVASFDTHGNSLRTLLGSVFGDCANFPVLDFNYGIELIAESYLSILRREAVISVQ